jgi:hypothetical protein
MSAVPYGASSFIPDGADTFHMCSSQGALPAPNTAGPNRQQLWNEDTKPRCRRSRSRTGRASNYEARRLHSHAGQSLCRKACIPRRQIGSVFRGSFSFLRELVVLVRRFGSMQSSLSYAKSWMTAACRSICRRFGSNDSSRGNSHSVVRQRCASTTAG